MSDYLYVAPNFFFFFFWKKEETRVPLFSVFCNQMVTVFICSVCSRWQVLRVSTWLAVGLVPGVVSTLCLYV